MNRRLPVSVPDEAVEAAAKAMYEQRPHATDPAHWETPWDQVPKAWRRGQEAAACAVLEAAMPAIRQQLAEEIRSLSAGDPAKRADCCLHEPDICDRCYGREQAAQHIEHGGDQ